MGASLPTRIKACFNAMETSQFKVTSMPSAGKVTLTVFFDSQGVSLSHFQKSGENVNSASYCEVLLKLRDVIRRKVLVNWQEGNCFIMTMLYPIQLEQSRREFKNYSGNFLNIRLTARTWRLVTSTCLVS
jgi:hypothetical protein